MQAMRDFAEGVDRQSPAWSDASVETYRRLCALQADSCTSLGYYLATRQREKEAVSAYERAWAKAEDRVLAANNTGWLVRYYLDHGQMRRALDIAKEAGETYSASGLETQAHALERVGRTEQAKAYYERIAERYDSRRELIGFLYRQARLELDERYEPELRRLLAKDFPKGLERLDRAKLPAPPVDGARVLDESVESRLAGLKVGDIIVARDGWRTHNREQYWTIRELAWAEPSTVVVWSEGRYRDVTTTTPDRSFGCSLGAYHGRPAGPPAPPGK